MGNENENLDRETKKLEKMRKEAIKNNNKITKAIVGEDNNSNDENELDEENEKQYDEYDKEISKMLFDEEAELDEGERLKKMRKKDKTSELKSYAEQIAEEQFMEEINRSKSVNRDDRRRKVDSDEDSDGDDFNAYQRWKERKKKKIKEKESKKNKNQNNIKIQCNDDEEENNIRTEKNKKKRNISSDKNQRNYNTVKNNYNNEDYVRNYYTEQNNEKKNQNLEEDNLNINEEIQKNKDKDKEKTKKNSKGIFGGGFFGFGKKKEKEQEKKNENQDNSYKTQNSDPEVQYSFNAMQQTPQMNYTPINNNMPQNYNNYNPVNSTPYGYPSVNPSLQNYNQMGTPTGFNPPMYNPSQSMTPMGQSIGQNQGISPYMNQNPMPFNPPSKEQFMQQIDFPQYPQKKSTFSFFGKKSAISKKVYSKIKPEDLKIVLLYMKNSNNKYQEGLDLCGRRKYNEAQTCFLQARSSYINCNKIMNGNPKAYPTEFRNVISQKINEKLALVYQSLKECNSFIKGKNTAQILQNPEKAEDILRNINSKNNNYDMNFNLGNMNNNNVNNMNNTNTNNAENKKKNIHEKEEDEMDEKIESEIMDKNPGVKFDDIIGMQEMKRILYEIIVVPTIRPDLFTGIRKPQRGILLFGPPGTGKTMIAKAIASECNSTFFNISASSLTSKWVGESEKTVKSLFKLAYKKVPSIIFIDEIDSILSKRNESENEATKRLKTEFLIQFDGLGSNTNARLLVIAATNRPMDLDEALLRRLPKRVYCGPLEEEGRFEFIKKVINRVETRLSDRDIKEIAKMTVGYSNSDLKELCKEAAYQPVRELTMEEILRIPKFRPIVKNDLVKAVHKIRGSLNRKIIKELLDWNEQFGGV